ncbi:MAG: hypothetical protein ABI910_03440 [Gemmatimonadota bacterium]
MTNRPRRRSFERAHWGGSAVGGKPLQRGGAVRKLWWYAAMAACVAAAGRRDAAAQGRLPSDGGFTASLGQPARWLWTFGVSTGIGRREGNSSGLGEGRAGVYHELLNPVLGVGGAQLELYNGAFDTKYNAGLRLRFVSPISGISAGADYNATVDQLRPMFTYVYPLRRSGVFGDGSVVRLDAIGGRDRSLMIGVEKPVFRRIPLGSTRSRRDRVRLHSPPPPAAPLPVASAALRLALSTARDAALAVGRLTVPPLDHTGGGGATSDAAVMAHLDTLKRFVSATGSAAMRTEVDETRRLHDAMDRAFSLAMSPGDSLRVGSSPLGLAAAARARDILLREVLLPYNRLLGQIKEDDTTREFAVLARGQFVRWLSVSGKFSPLEADAALAVFTEYLELAEAVRGAAARAWGHSRFIWLPLQLALLPEQHDTQGELDALVELATREDFTEGNAASYIINEQFQYQLSRTIREANEYHVLLTHDFRGYDAQGDPDEMSFRHVLHSYLSTLTARVRAYDSTGTFPVYMILLDEWFYNVNGGRLWMELLEDPTRHTVKLPARFAAWGDSLRVAQDSLRAAIQGSTLLRAQRRQYGEAWLRNLVKVHVSITNSADPSFWSWRVASFFPMPDAWMRDHRKIAFYDITEADPYRGEAIFTGAGIGEHYANLAWEDRSILVRGPAVLGLKETVRYILVKQGIAPDRIPYALLPQPLAPDYAARVRAETARIAYPLRALLVQNGTGFDSKYVNVAKAVLYTLMPAGSVIKIPDSLWNGTFWGSALVGCALRGVRVLVIAPALSNAPAHAFGSMVRGRELAWRLLAAARTLAPEIAASGGLLKVGMFATELRVTDIAGKAAAVKNTFERNMWLHDLFDFPDEVYPALDSIATALRSLPGSPSASNGFESYERSYLHLKANFFASREAWTVMSRADWAPLMGEFAQLRLAQLERPAAAVANFQEYPDALRDIGGHVLRRWYDDLPAETRERVVFFTVIGSANQNDRSFVLDGEDALVISRWPSVLAYLDLITLIGQSQWIEGPAELDRFLPSHSAIQTRLAHWFRFVF